MSSSWAAGLGAGLSTVGGGLLQMGMKQADREFQSETEKMRMKAQEEMQIAAENRKVDRETKERDRIATQRTKVASEVQGGMQSQIDADLNKAKDFVRTSPDIKSETQRQTALDAMDKNKNQIKSGDMNGLIASKLLELNDTQGAEAYRHLAKDAADEEYKMAQVGMEGAKTDMLREHYKDQAAKAWASLNLTKEATNRAKEADKAYADAWLAGQKAMATDKPEEKKAFLAQAETFKARAIELGKTLPAEATNFEYKNLEVAQKALKAAEENGDPALIAKAKLLVESEIEKQSNKSGVKSNASSNAVVGRVGADGKLTMNK